MRGVVLAVTPAPDSGADVPQAPRADVTLRPSAIRRALGAGEGDENEHENEDEDDSAHGVRAAAENLVVSGGALEGRVVRLGGGNGKPRWAEAVCQLGAGAARVRVPVGGGGAALPGTTKAGDAVRLVLRSVMPHDGEGDGETLRAVGARATSGGKGGALHGGASSSQTAMVSDDESDEDDAASGEEEEEEDEESDEDEDGSDSEGDESENEDEDGAAVSGLAAAAAASSSGSGSRMRGGGGGEDEEGEDEDEDEKTEHEAVSTRRRPSTQQQSARDSELEKEATSGGADAEAWVRWMSHRAAQGDLEGAREAGQTASERLRLRGGEVAAAAREAVWTARLALEQTSGTPQSLGRAFALCLQQVPPRRAYAIMLGILRDAGRWDEAEGMYATAARAYGGLGRKQLLPWEEGASAAAGAAESVSASGGSSEGNSAVVSDSGSSKDLATADGLWWGWVGDRYGRGDADGARLLLRFALAALPKKCRQPLVLRAASSEFRGEGAGLGGSRERGRRLLQGVVDSKARALDAWTSWSELEEGHGGKDGVARARGVLRRMCAQKLPKRKARTAFRAWLAFEARCGGEEEQGEARAAAEVHFGLGTGELGGAGSGSGAGSGIADMDADED